MNIVTSYTQTNTCQQANTKMNTVPSVCPKGTRRCSVWEKPAQVIKGLVTEKNQEKIVQGKE